MIPAPHLCIPSHLLGAGHRWGVNVFIFSYAIKEIFKMKNDIFCKREGTWYPDSRVEMDEKKCGL